MLLSECDVECFFGWKLFSSHYNLFVVLIAVFMLEIFLLINFSYHKKVEDIKMTVRCNQIFDFIFQQIPGKI